jgi:hypothetical protein
MNSLNKTNPEIFCVLFVGFNGSHFIYFMDKSNISETLVAKYLAVVVFKLLPKFKIKLEYRR